MSPSETSGHSKDAAMMLSDMIQKNLDLIGQPRLTTQNTVATQNNPTGGLSNLLPLLILLIKSGALNKTPTNTNTNNLFASTPTTSNFSQQNPSQIYSLIDSLFA
jgi:endonuclease III